MEDNLIKILLGILMVWVGITLITWGMFNELT